MRIRLNDPSPLAPAYEFVRPLLAVIAVSGLGYACDPGSESGMDGATGGSATVGTGGSGTGGSTSGDGTGGSAGPSMFGTPEQAGSGSTSDRWAKAAVTRNGMNYFFMANGWGPGFQSQSVMYSGTSFTVTSMQGTQGAQYQPASYPTVFCGVYSDSMSGPCGLPKVTTEISSLRTGWRWSPNGSGGQYNAAYDIWLSTSNAISGHSSFLMVWLHDPVGQQPAGSLKASNISVPGVPGTWNLWSGTVSGKPCVSYVRPEGKDSLELEFDVLDFVRDVPTRSLTLPGSQILSVAVGFEIWNGPVTNLTSQDFYVDVQ